MRSLHALARLSAVVMVLLGVSTGCVSPGPTPRPVESLPPAPSAGPWQALPGFVVALELGDGLPWRIVAEGDSVWVLLREVDSGRSSVVRIDPTTNAAAAPPSAIGMDAWGFASGGDALWLMENGGEARLVRIDASTGVPDAPVAYEGRWPGAELTVAFGAVWTADADLRDDGGHTVTRIDPITKEITTTIPVGASPQAITAGPDAIWAANHDSGDISRIDPLTNRERRYDHGFAIHGLTFAAGRLWLAATHDSFVAALDPSSGQVTRRDLSFEPLRFAVPDDGGLWIAAQGVTETSPAGQLRRIDPADLTLGEVLDVGATTMDITAGFGALWIATRDPNLLIRLDG